MHLEWNVAALMGDKTQVDLVYEAGMWRGPVKRLIAGQSVAIPARHMAALCHVLSCGIAPVPPGRVSLDIPLLVWTQNGTLWGQLERLMDAVSGQVGGFRPLNTELYEWTGSTRIIQKYSKGHTGTLMLVKQLERLALLFGCPLGDVPPNTTQDATGRYLLRWVDSPDDDMVPDIRDIIRERINREPINRAHPAVAATDRRTAAAIKEKLLAGGRDLRFRYRDELRGTYHGVDTDQTDQNGAEEGE